MTKFDEKEKLIIKELIRNPRLSDNQIGRKTGIPIKTVNRKRKKLESNNVLNYFTYVNHSPAGTEKMNAKQLYLITYKRGLTRKYFIETVKHSEKLKDVGVRHILNSYLGEDNGQLVHIVIFESRVASDILEIFNSDLLPELSRLFGSDVVSNTKVIPITQMIRVLHNYVLNLNLDNGIMKADWPDHNIFID